jgi:hypothetical protein
MLLAGTSSAAAEKRIAIGLYAPTVPFGSPGQRLATVTGLAKHLSAAAPGARVTGRVFARAADLVTAIRQGSVQFAVIDAPYAAAAGLPYRILAAAQRRGRAKAPWVVVAGSGIKTLADLAKKRLVVPRIGAKRDAFATGALLEGEVRPSYFKGISAAPDPLAAITMVKLGRAEAALVPGATVVSGGLSRVMTLRSVGHPMFVVARGVDPTITRAFAERIRSYRGSTFSGFTAPSAGGYRQLRASIGIRHRRGPMAIPSPSRPVLGGLLGKRSFPMPVVGVRKLLESAAKP